MTISKYADVLLREFEETDIAKKVEWINEPENNRFLHYDLPLQFDRTLEWFRKKDNTKRLDCVIEYEGTPVGLIGLLNIDRVHSKAEYYITIGEPRLKHRGIATKATKAIIDYAFASLKLHKVYLTVDAKNKAAIGLYEKSGFRQEGYFVDDLFCARSAAFIDRARYAALNKNENVRGGGTLYFEIFNRANFPLVQSPIQSIGEVQGNAVFVKRDDLIPFSFGGNKVRKAILFFEEIDAGGYDTVVTYGSGSSNHCRIIANMAVSRGLHCHIISTEDGNVSLNRRLVSSFGAAVTVCSVEEVASTIDTVMANYQRTGRKPYFIPGGGHGNIGTKAYDLAFDEIMEYEKQAGFSFDYIFHASGTGTTQAGLICGKKRCGSNAVIVGISIARANPRGGQVVADSVRDYLHGEAGDDLNFDDSYICGGYGRHNIEIDAVIHRAMEQYGMPLDSTYTGKAFWGMEQFLVAHKISGKKVLFLHTGGTPIFCDWMK